MSDAHADAPEIAVLTEIVDALTKRVLGIEHGITTIVDVTLPAALQPHTATVEGLYDQLNEVASRLARYNEDLLEVRERLKPLEAARG